MTTTTTMIVLKGINEFATDVLGVYTSIEIATAEAQMYEEKRKKLRNARNEAMSLGTTRAHEAGLAHGGDPRKPEWHAYHKYVRRVEAVKFEELTGMTLEAYFSFPSYYEYEYQPFTVNAVF